MMFGQLAPHEKTERRRIRRIECHVALNQMTAKKKGEELAIGAAARRRGNAALWAPHADVAVALIPRP
eukprot:1058454-Pyramimonas_sp.AAC.1